MRRRHAGAATATAAAALLLVGAAPAVSDSWDYAVVHEGPFVIGKDLIYQDDLIIRNGTLTVYGILEGSVRQEGKGGVYVAKGGELAGTVTESSSGGIRVSGTFWGSVQETGTGSVIVHSTGRISGDVSEGGSAGNIDIRGRVGGSAVETRAGHLWVRPKATVVESVSEEGAGDLYLYKGASVGGDVTESGPGKLVRR
jgi:hypothetical protein